MIAKAYKMILSKTTAFCSGAFYLLLATVVSAQDKYPRAPIIAEDPTRWVSSKRPETLTDVALFIASLINAVIPILVGVAVIMFLWGLIRYITTPDPAKKKEAISVIIYGIITLFVMVAVWGLVYLIANTLGIRLDGGAALPVINQPSSF